ncbi:MAG: hypothetical protein M2R45_02504 [Verrucomicrobia subdivision 3 bacterium]|nr:hypothetical protein [Limisphaerales bacterium]MCS1413294.1 hypothetical protein [Limisphaerales bacterium]
MEEAAERYEAVIEHYQRALAINGDYAELCFSDCWGVVLKRLGRVMKRCKPSVARNLDALPFRTDSRLNEVVRELGKDRVIDDFVLLESGRLFARAVGGGVKLPRLEFSHEHVHFRFAGDYLMAKQFFEVVV